MHCLVEPTNFHKVQRESLPWLESFGMVNGSLGDVEQALSLPLLRQLTRLSFSCNQLTAAGARKVAACPHLSHLTQLDLSGNKIGLRGVEALLASPHLSRVTTLRLGMVGLGPAPRRLPWLAIPT